MPVWEDMVGAQTPPAERVEHELRYRLAVPVVRDAALWVDLGCGAGAWAAAAFADAPPEGAVVLVDRDEAAATEAARALGARDVVALTADLDTEAGLAAVRAAVADGPPGDRVVTCFGTLARLTAFAGLVDLLVSLREEHGATVILSVPNDAFGGAPSGPNVWGVGAFEELYRLLPAETVVAHQTPVRGSAVVAPGADATLAVGDVDVPAEHVPSDLLAVFGPRADRFASGALARAADLDAERRVVRDRESDLVVLETQAVALQDQLEQAQARIAELQRAGRSAPSA